MTTERPRFFDDLAGVAGGAFSALAGVREEVETLMRARVEEAIRRLDLVRREDVDALQEMAANARAGQEAAEARVVSVEARLAAVEGRLAALEARRVAAPGGASPEDARSGARAGASGGDGDGPGAPPSPEGVA